VGAGRSLVSRQTLTIAAIVVAVGGGAIWFWRGAGHPAESAAVRRTARTASTAASSVASESPSAPNAKGKTVAVLPFENLSADKANEYFSDGISDEISNVLSKVPGLRVAGRASAFSFKGRQVTDAEIAAKLGVAFLLTGTVQTSGNQVRIGARLTSAAEGFQVWSERFTRELKDIFAVQDEIATLIAGKLELELGGTRRTTRSVDPEAHRLVLEGRYHLSLRTKAGFARGEEAFGRALECDPGFAEAHAGLAEVCVMRANYATQDGAGLDDGQADLAKARAEAQRAIAVDAENPDAQAVLGYCDFIEGRPQEAERWYRRALEIAPNRSVFYAWRAMLRLGQGRLDEGLSDMEKTIALDPLWPVSLANYAEVLSRAGRAADSLQATERALNFRQGVYVPALGVRTQVLWALGRQEEAVAAARTIRTHLRQNPRRGADEAAIWVLAQAGHAAEAEAYREEYFQTLPAGSHQRGFALGALGRFEEALLLLERTPSLVRRRLFWDPIWDPWRSDPRFQQLLATLGCTAEYATARTSQERLLQERKAGP
jgi:TolB-like protein/Tfp pilus assembly protein PilF